MAKMPDPKASCLKSSVPWSGAASLASVSAFHGIPLATEEVVSVSGMNGASSNQEATALIMGRALGYEAVAMEGEFENLPEVALPMLATLRESEEDRFAVLYAVTETSVTVGDPLSGEVSVWPRDRFASVWTGSVIQVTPVEEERTALTNRLREIRDRVRQVLLAIGWAPPYGRRIAMLLAWVGVFALAWAAAGGEPSRAASIGVWFVAFACAGSLWSWLASESCGACSQAHRLAGGLPLAPAGTALYGLLLAGAFVPVPAVATSVAIGAAAGTHAALVRELAKARVTCWACVFVALCALGAATAAVVTGAPSWALGISALAAGGGTMALLPRIRAKEALRWRVTAEALAQKTSAEPRPSGVVRVVAFTRKGCNSCAFFHAAIKPALRATFEETIQIDERDLGSTQTLAPLLLVLGARRTLFVGLPSGDPCERVIATVQVAVDAGSGAPGDPGELSVIQG
jgi:predicted double-glycine peptidase